MSHHQHQKWTKGGIALLAVTAVLFAVDRVLKFGVFGRGGGKSGGWFRYRLYENHGIAFSLPFPEWLFWPAALVIFAVLAWSFWTSLKTDKFRAATYVLVLAGALSNLTDRAVYKATIDYFNFFNRSAVNIADGMIVAGLLMLTFGRTKQPAGEAHDDAKKAAN